LEESVAYKDKVAAEISGRHKKAIMDLEAAKVKVEEMLSKRETEYTALKLKCTSLDNKCDRL
jgi:hypothetical protein